MPGVPGLLGPDENGSSRLRQAGGLRLRCNDVPVTSHDLDDLAHAVPPPEDDWSDAFEVVQRFRDAVEMTRPPQLAAVTGAWRDPYLELRLTHSDGSVVDIVHGDGYTEIVGGPLSYKHYLATEELTAVLTAALDGRLNYVPRHRFGRLVDSYFTVAGVDRRLGADSLNLGRMLAWLPGRDRRLRVSFADSRAFSLS